jgi:ATP-dependent Lon protease
MHIKQENNLVDKYYSRLKDIMDDNNILFSFYKKYLMSMAKNLSYMNSIKLYQDTDSMFMSILEELTIIKKEIDTNIVIKKNTVNERNVITSNLLLKYSNHIVPNDINMIFKLFIGNNWKLLFKDNMDELNFIQQYIEPIYIWDSEYHTSPIPIETKKKTKGISQDIIESLGMLSKKKPFDAPYVDTIIINSSDSNIFKSISEILELKSKNSFEKDTHDISVSDFASFTNMINIRKNSKAYTLIEDKLGVSIYIKLDNRYILIQGIVSHDLLNISTTNKYVNNIINNNTKIIQEISIPDYFKSNYLKTMNLRDIIVLSSSEVVEDITKKYNEYKTIQCKPFLTLVNEFLLASKYRKIDVLSLLLMSNEDDMKLGCILFDIFKAKDKKDVSTEIYNSLHFSIRELLNNSTKAVIAEENRLMSLTESDISYEKRSMLLKTGDDVKTRAMEKLKQHKTNYQGDPKVLNWLDGLLKIPFGIYCKNEIISFKSNFIQEIKYISPDINIVSDDDITNYVNNNNNLKERWDEHCIKKKLYLADVRKTLDSVVFGHKDAKLQLERLFAQWINGEMKGAIIGLMGPPGIGKTSLAKNGLSKCLKDANGNPCPFAFLPIGGSVNSSTLIGHNFTYVGSSWGRIVDILITAKCMNPIIFIDEIDKVSQTEHGREIISVLTHLTDSTQNDEFEDKYFSGIKLDLSKALIVFSFNDINLIDPILRDRITIIEAHPLKINEKLTIMKDYMLPEICKDTGFNSSDIVIDNSTMQHLIETYTNEAGVRKVKEKMIELVRDINLNKFHKNNISLPFTITNNVIDKLFENKPKIRNKKIVNEPTIGLVNGLYATSSGLGGLTMIQLSRFPSDKMLDIMLTGKPGDMMKESVQYALKVAWGLLGKKEQAKILKLHASKKSFGIHAHCPDAATPKDGPSAGAAFTLAIYSLLVERKINNKVCMTGEIDLFGNVTAIGGLESKLYGGKKAGCTIALIPFENMEDLEILRRENISPEDNTFVVHAVHHINDVIKYALL